MIQTNHLNAKEKHEILRVCKNYINVFQKPDEKLTCNSNVRHKIKTNCDPIFKRARRYIDIHIQ